MSKIIELEGFEFTAVEPTELEGLKRALRKCQNEAEKQAVCQLWNDTVETVGYFSSVMVPALLADMRMGWEG
jgi:hypothetical protein